MGVRELVAEQTLGDGKRRDGHQPQFEAVEHETEKRGGQHGPAAAARKFQRRGWHRLIDIRSLPCQLQVVLIRGWKIRPAALRLRNESKRRIAIAVSRPASRRRALLALAKRLRGRMDWPPGSRSRGRETSLAGSSRDGKRSSCRRAGRRSCRCSRTSRRSCPTPRPRSCGLRNRGSCRYRAAGLLRVALRPAAASRRESRGPFPPGRQRRTRGPTRTSNPTGASIRPVAPQNV